MLTPEQKNEAMTTELRMLRNTIIWMVPKPFSKLIEPPFDATIEELKVWDSTAAARVVEAADFGDIGRTPCPLCGDCPRGGHYVRPGGDDPQNGYTDDGLQRHLMGTHRQSQCLVMRAVWGKARKQWKDMEPGGFGPYGWE